MKKSLYNKRLAYERLIQRVMGIDKDAAKYLAHEAPILDEFYHAERLSQCFLWCDTPQGSAYWLKISDKLGEG